MQHRTCRTCGNDFLPTTPNQVFCPPSQEDRARQTRQARSKCAKAWKSTVSNAQYRAATEQAKCKHCTKTFDRTRGRSQHVYCSDRCHKLAKSLAKRIHPPKPRPHLHPIAAPRPGHDTLTDAEWADVLANDPCSYCYGTASGVDHIDPTSRDGTDTPDNWTASCHRCNGRKTSTPLLPFLNWDRTQREFQPWRELVAAHHRS